MPSPASTRQQRGRQRRGNGRAAVPAQNSIGAELRTSKRGPGPSSEFGPTGNGTSQDDDLVSQGENLGLERKARSKAGEDG